MRLVEWNCCQGFDRKIEFVAQQGCDVAVVCEVAQAAPSASLLALPPRTWLWQGSFASKGLALAGLTQLLTPVLPAGESGSFCVAATLPTGTGLLGIWTVPTSTTENRYSREAEKSILAHAGWLRSTPAIVAGDFNFWRRRNHDQRDGVVQVFDLLADLGYDSAYHHHTGEEFGSETLPTYFHYRRRSEPWFIDYCFVHEDLLPQLRSVEVGSYDVWVAANRRRSGRSDHVPTIIDLDL